jgi:hypothetical protein
VAYEDQKLDGVGKTLATVIADHAGLTVPWPISNTSASYRQTLSRSIFMAVGQQETTP